VTHTVAYDGDGRRRSYADSVQLRNFIPPHGRRASWDGENILFQTDSDNATCRSYTLRPELFGELISQDGPTFHHYDALGSTMLLTDPSQNTVISYLYRAFGEQTILSGSNPNRFGWVGRLGYYCQPDTSDYWVRARIYRPTIGRWVSRDPVYGVDVNRYMYVQNRAPQRADPSGLFTCIKRTYEFPGMEWWTAEGRVYRCTCPADPKLGEPSHCIFHIAFVEQGIWPFRKRWTECKGCVCVHCKGGKERRKKGTCTDEGKPCMYERPVPQDCKRCSNWTDCINCCKQGHNNTPGWTEQDDRDCNLACLTSFPPPSPPSPPPPRPLSPLSSPA